MWDVYRRHRRYCERTEQEWKMMKTETLKKKDPRAYWDRLERKPRSQYRGRWKPDGLAKYWSEINLHRFDLNSEAKERLARIMEHWEAWEWDFQDILDAQS